MTASTPETIQTAIDDDWRPRSTPEQVRAILATIVALDPRMTAPDAATATIRARVWHDLIGECDPDWALRFVQRAYAEPRPFPLTPAEIRAAWRDGLADQHAAVDAERDREVIDRDPAAWSQAFDTLRTLLRGGTATMRSTGRVLTAEQDAWSRRCLYWRLCACSHRYCRDGWLDAEGEVTRQDGSTSPGVVRCPACRDGILIAEEKGIAKPLRGTRR